MKIVVIGSGGREHALVNRFETELGNENVYAIPGNAGIKNSVDIKINNFVAIKEFCDKNQIKWIFVGPEQPLTEGIVDYFMNSSVNVFGADKKSSKLESSKIFAKNFMKKYLVSTAEYTEFNNFNDAHKLIEQLSGDLVVKYDGLAGGKGVFVCSDIKEAYDALNDLKENYGDNSSFLIEKKLTGEEISIIGITDGKNIKLLQPSQDHKQIYDGDKGPNTGGMGAYSPVPFCDESMMNKIREKIVIPTMNGIIAENMNYKGIIYFGIMISENTPFLLEYNVRFGDPETEVILPALKSSFTELIKACFDNTLKSKKLVFSDKYFVDIVLTSGGYPKKYKTGYEINGLDKLNAETMVFHAGTIKKDDKILSSGGRVLNIVSSDKNLKNAIGKAYSECKKISFRDMYYREDIGNRDGD